MKLTCRLCVAIFFAIAVGSLFASDEQSASLPKPDGFIFCPGHDNQLASLYLNPCRRRAVGTLACGTKVSVLSRHEDMLKILTSDGFPRFVSAALVSQRPDVFVAFDHDSGIPERGMPDCSRMMARRDPGWNCVGSDCPERPDPSVTPPHAIFQPDPEFSEEARRKKISGTILIALTVGVDGLPHDIKVEKGLGYGLDEKAMEAVNRWKFEPAQKDGQPVETRIHAEVSFKIR